MTIPKSVTSISGFNGCSGLSKVIVKDVDAWCKMKFSSITNSPLYYAKHLYCDENTEITDLIIPEDVTNLCDKFLFGCSGITSVTIPSSVTSIGSSAFSGCPNLEYFACGTLLEQIAPQAFTSKALRLFRCKADVPPQIGSRAFINVNKEECILQVPKNSIETYKNAAYWMDFTHIEAIPAVLGDVNGDESVTMADVNRIVNMFLGEGK